MQSRYSQTKEQAFVLKPEDLEKLISTLQKRELNLKMIGISCKDEFFREFELLDEFLDYENAKGKEISSMSIYFRSVDNSQSISIDFRSYQTWSSISTSVDVSDNSNYVVKEDIDDILSGMRPWYNILTITKYSILTFVIGVAILFTSILLFYKDLQTFYSIKTVEVILSLRFTFIVFMLVFIYLSTKVYGYLFPRGVFAINQGASRFDFQQKVLKIILISIFVPIFVGIVVRLIFI